MREPEVAPHGPAANGRDTDDARSLAQRAARRDPAAWSTLFDAHYPAIYAFLRYRLHGAADAEDLASQVFEVAYARADRFDYRGVPIEAWLLGIARNLSRDHIKKAGRRGFHEEFQEAHSPPEPDAAPSVDLHQDLQTAMQRLTPDQQEVLALRFLLDRSVEETARLMNRSEDAVKNLQRRALAAMLRALHDAGYPGAKSP